MGYRNDTNDLPHGKPARRGKMALGVILLMAVLAAIYVFWIRPPTCIDKISMEELLAHQLKIDTVIVFDLQRVDERAFVGFRNQDGDPGMAIFRIEGEERYRFEKLFTLAELDPAGTGIGSTTYDGCWIALSANDQLARIRLNKTISGDAGTQTEVKLIPVDRCPSLTVVPTENADRQIAGVITETAFTDVKGDAVP